MMVCAFKEMGLPTDVTSSLFNLGGRITFPAAERHFHPQ